VDVPCLLTTLLVNCRFCFAVEVHIELGVSIYLFLLFPFINLPLR
jgi:hypothetical protein